MKQAIIALGLLLSQNGYSQATAIKIEVGETATLACADARATPYALTQTSNKITVDCKRTCIFRIDANIDYIGRTYYNVMGKYSGQNNFAFHGNSAYNYDAALQLAEREVMDASTAHSTICERIIKQNF